MRIRSAVIGLTVVALVVGAFFVPAQAQGRKDTALVLLGQEPTELFDGFVDNLSVELNRARQLLAEAGFTPGPDGILRDRTGKRFEISIMTTAGNAVREQMQQIVKDQLRQVGIDLRIDNRPASVLFGQLLRERSYPHLILFAWGVPTTSHSITVWHSKQIPTRENNFVGQNGTGYRNAEVDKLLDASEVELDAAKRKALLQKAQSLLAEDLPSIPLYFRPELHVSRRTLKNYKPRGIGQPTWNASEWAW